MYLAGTTTAESNTLKKLRKNNERFQNGRSSSTSEDVIVLNLLVFYCYLILALQKEQVMYS